MTAARIVGDVLLLPVVKAVLAVPLPEVERLVTRDRETWFRAIKRGKAFRRGEATHRREVTRE